MQHLRAPDVPPGAVLSVLMKQPGNRQVDLHHIATQSDISEMINGKRAMRVSEIKGTGEILHVRWICLSASNNSARLFAPKAQTNNPAKNPRQEGEALDDARKWAGLVIVTFLTAHFYLDKLCCTCGKLSALLHFFQQTQADISFAQCGSQIIGAGNGILDSQVHANSANWRHGVGCVTDAEYAWFHPVIESVDTDIQQSELLPFCQWLQARQREGGYCGDLLFETIDPRLFYRGVLAFINGVAALPKATAIEHNKVLFWPLCPVFHAGSSAHLFS